MKDEYLSVSEFKTTCLQLIERMKNSSMPVLILKHGKPAARLPPVAGIKSHKKLFRSLAEEAVECSDLITPLEPQAWETLDGCCLIRTSDFGLYCAVARSPRRLASALKTGWEKYSYLPSQSMKR